LLHSDGALRDLLERLPGSQYRLQLVADWDALRSALRRSPPTAVAVVDPSGPSGEGGALSTELRDLLSEHPTTTVVAALHVSPTEPDVLRTLLEWGVADWLDLTREDTPAAVERRLRSVRSRPLQRLLQRALPRGVPSRTRGLLLVAAEVVSSGGQIPEIASALGVHRRTVPRWFQRADLPPPQRLFAWLRLLLAADLLDDPGRSVESVARGCGYAGAPSLKTALRNLMKTTPRALREQGAFLTVAKAFAVDLFEHRERAREGGRPAKTWLN
jgi:AraC-like DNA-binding protein